MNPQSFQFNPRSLRVKQARLARILRKSILLGARILALALIVGGGYLVVSDSSLGYLAVALGTLLAMILVWNQWQLSGLDTQLSEQALGQGKLEQILAADVAAIWQWPASPQKIWQLISGHWQVRFFTVRFGIDPLAIEPLLSTNAADGSQVMQVALEMSTQLTLKGPVSAGALAAALITTAPNVDAQLAQLKLEKKDIAIGLRWLSRIQRIIAQYQNKHNFGGLARDWTGGYTPLLSQLGLDLSSDVQAGAAYHGETNIRAGLIDEIIGMMAQPTRSAVVLVGETGVGKTLTVYSMAEKLLRGESAALRYQHIVLLNASVLLSNAQGPGQVEQLLLQALSEASRAKNIILFLDDAEVFFSEGVGALDISKLLLPALQANAVRLIVAMTPNDWQKLKASDSALANLFNYVAVNEPTEEETVHILQDQTLLIESKIAATNKVRITYQAIQEAYKLAGRYVQDLAYPDRAIRLLETAVNHGENGLVTARSVEMAVEATQGVKVTQASAQEGQQLLNLEEELHKRMINQSRAVKVVSDALRRARAGVSNQNRPLGTFLFLGPTGVGKTELSKSLADVYFGGREHMVRVDMTEYSQPGSVDRLLDAGTASTTNTFLAKMRQNPFSVVLFDEIEKAHPDVLNLFLQMLDEGRLTDSNGRVVSLKDAIIITTSNAGADRIRAKIEAGQQLEQFEEEFENELINSGQFRPEFLNRFDEIVLFRPLTPDELKQVVYLLMAEVNGTLADRKVTIALSERAVEWLVQKGYDPRLGARPMRRMIQRSVENVVAKRLLAGSVQPGEQLQLDVDDLETPDTRGI